MSFGMTTYGQPNAFVDFNGNPQPTQNYPGESAQIYTAMYSGVAVYEMEVNKVSVMRRRADSWLNATQILKVAGVDKGKRTKVLEKEILADEHEKVQGGYGKYQGTWITYKRGRDLCRQYGVEEALRPLLEYDMGQDGISVAGRGSITTPTKEQALAAQRKKLMYNGHPENRQPAQSPSGTFFKNISATAANAVNAINKARLDSPVSRPGSSKKKPVQTRRPSQPLESSLPGSSQHSSQTLHSEASLGNVPRLEPAFEATYTPPRFTNHQSSGSNLDMHAPAAKRARPSSRGVNMSMKVRKTTASNNNDFLAYQPAAFPTTMVDGAFGGLPPLPQPTTPVDQEKQRLLIELFMDPLQTDFSNHPAFERLAGEDLDIPMDVTAHTALHWAATLARISLLRALIFKGASIYRVNVGGETALIRAAFTTNNLDNGSFPYLLELLGPTIEMRDGRGRTLLHHIAVSSAVHKKGPACKYYLESLLEFVVRQGSAPSSQVNSFNGDLGLAPPRPRAIGLARFMTDMVNATDRAGDTALNLVARIGNKSIIQQLLEVGASPIIPNHGGLKPVDFGVGGDPDPADASLSSQQSIPNSEKTMVNRVAESSRDLMSSMTALVSTAETSFRTEVNAKQSSIDQTHIKLREATVLLAAERQCLEVVQKQREERKAIEHRIAAFRRSTEEQKALLLRPGPSGNVTSPTRTDVKIGDADAGLAINHALLPPQALPGQTVQLTAQQEAYLASLPPTEILQARVEAYRINNENLERLITQIKGRSVKLEERLRRVVALCTGLAEKQVDGMLGNLVVAVESDGGVDMEVDRVRNFLRKVEEAKM